MMTRIDKLVRPSEEVYKVGRLEAVVGFGAGQISLKQSERS
jgi:hypothetical protein